MDIKNDIFKKAYENTLEKSKSLYFECKPGSDFFLELEREEIVRLIVLEFENIDFRVTGLSGDQIYEVREEIKYHFGITPWS